MATIHWLGAGLSSVPGIRRLAASGHQLILWNRTLEKAVRALDGLETAAQAREFKWDRLQEAVQSGDLVVSMLPATLHLQVAKVCLANNAHFVSSSYISDEMRQLSQAASDQGLSFVNEVGLDPGLDHLMAHVLVHQYRNSTSFDPANEISFRSYCGGFPKTPNDFKYKFSWSPLGVLKALKSPAAWISGNSVCQSERPWTSITEYETHLPTGSETFQAYPNRDSLPFMPEYCFENEWNVKEFVRGTLRLDGWSAAWKEIFELVESASGDQGLQDLETKSDELWENYRYQDGEPDRVVLSVEFEATQGGETVWHQVYCLDSSGNEQGSAMARLVSWTTSIAVEAVLAGEIEPGVSPAPKNIAVVNKWLQQMTTLGESFELITLCNKLSV